MAEVVKNTDGLMGACVFEVRRCRRSTVSHGRTADS